MKKRGISVDQSDESLGLINNEYGNVTTLVEKVKKLEEENERLKKKETNFMQDAMTKRRQFGQLTPYGNRSISLVLQSYLNSLQKYGGNLKLEFDKGNVNFEDICRDPNFTMANMSFEENEVSSSLSSTGSFSQVGIPHSGRDPLNSIQDCITSNEQQCKKLVMQINSTPILPANFTDYPNTTHEKLMQENYESFLTIREKSRNIESINEESVSLVHAIIKTIAEKSVLCGHYSSIIDAVKPLIESHTALSNKQNQNMAIARVLFAIIASFGSNLLRPQPVIDMKNYVKQSCVYQDNMMPLSVSEKEMSTTQTSSVKKKSKRKKSYKTQQTSSTFNNNVSSVKSINQTDFLVHSHQYELLAGLELTLEIGETIGIKREHLTSPITIIKDNLAAIQSMLKDNIDSFNDWKTERLLQIHESSKVTLRKQFQSQKVQTDLMQLKDAAFQADEEREKKKH